MIYSLLNDISWVVNIRTPYLTPIFEFLHGWDIEIFYSCLSRLFIGVMTEKFLANFL